VLYGDWCAANVAVNICACVHVQFKMGTARGESFHVIVIKTIFGYLCFGVYRTYLHPYESTANRSAVIYNTIYVLYYTRWWRRRFEISELCTHGRLCVCPSNAAVAYRDQCLNMHITMVCVKYLTEIRTEKILFRKLFNTELKKLIRAWIMITVLI